MSPSGDSRTFIAGCPKAAILGLRKEPGFGVMILDGIAWITIRMVIDDNEFVIKMFGRISQCLQTVVQSGTRVVRNNDYGNLAIGHNAYT